MVDEEEELLRLQTEERNNLQNRLEQEQVQQAVAMQDNSQNIVKEQLDLTSELRKIQNLLRGRVEIVSEDGVVSWQEPTSSDEVLLSEAGINLILNTVQFYLNKNTLLSNYDEATIYQKMEDLGISIADALFMRYEKYFLYPTEKECQAKLLERLEKRKQNIIYNAELYGKEVDEKVVESQLLEEIEPDKERKKIREGLIKDKLKGFDLLMRNIQDVVHSSYLRALAGQERRTLRQHIHISENLTPPTRTQSSKSGFNWFKKQ